MRIKINIFKEKEQRNIKNIKGGRHRLIFRRFLLHNLLFDLKCSISTLEHIRPYQAEGEVSLGGKDVQNSIKCWTMIYELH